MRKDSPVLSPEKPSGKPVSNLGDRLERELPRTAGQRVRSFSVAANTYRVNWYAPQPVSALAWESLPRTIAKSRFLHVTEDDQGNLLIEDRTVAPLNASRSPVG